MTGTMPTTRDHVVVTVTNVLINFIHLARRYKMNFASFAERMAA